MAVRELALFSIVRKGEIYRISIEDGNGDTIEYSADFEVLDSISEAIEEALESEDEDELEVEDEDEDDK